MEEHYGRAERPDVIVGLEARGFLFGPSLALRLGAGFVPVRKQGKLPGPTETAGYEKEYGTDFFQIQADGIKPGQKVLIVDDIIATGAYIVTMLYGQLLTSTQVALRQRLDRWLERSVVHCLAMCSFSSSTSYRDAKNSMPALRPCCQASEMLWE